ncbi:MAG: hypothetical protein ABI670_13865 [Chloroflexota bacterium]
METTENSDQVRNEQIGGMAGMGAGMMAGARIGSALLPIPLVGTFVGAMLGGVFGTEVGKRVGPAIINAGTAFVQTMTTAPAPQQETMASAEDAPSEGTA